MNTKNRRLARGLIVGAALVGLAGTTPAYAEGSWSSYISGWTSGKESRRWTDNNTDSVSTSVGFSGCASDGGGGFKHAQLKLWKDVFGPDDDQGTKTNYCNRVYWGDKSSGKYYFELWGVVSGGYLSVKSVNTRY
ncbi:hypothetical protein QCN29_22775 [Streptomyces sp. HNM0663]|uniref:Secreted protein n=1 Tax=Streptomyces chengmaiensis TaxID=3040919 RepID=A0ABT6HS83_9ACTN|nr:hypothetical protein [Streptomyces chengmaiensis]MDH2391551.1 hypothetical protein [Streptomyces chengmaiensis]